PAQPCASALSCPASGPPYLTHCNRPTASCPHCLRCLRLHCFASCPRTASMPRATLRTTPLTLPCHAMSCSSLLRCCCRLSCYCCTAAAVVLLRCPVLHASVLPCPASLHAALPSAPLRCPALHASALSCPPCLMLPCSAHRERPATKRALHALLPYVLALPARSCLAPRISPTASITCARSYSPGGGASRARQRKPLSPQQRREWAVRWGATTGGTCESTHAGSAASRHGGSGGGQHQQQCPLETLSPQQLRFGGGEWGGGGCVESPAPPPPLSPTAAAAAEGGGCVGDDGVVLEGGVTTVTPLTAPVPVTLADPSGGPVVVRGATVLPCPVAPSGLLTGLHLPSFAKNLVATSVLQDQWVTVTQPGGKLVAIYMDSRTGEHLATFIRRLGSGQYTMTTESALVAESGQVAASVEVAVSCSSRLLTHQTLLWHHHLGHPSLPRLRGMHSRLLVSGLPRSLPPLLRSLASPCLPCVEGRQRAAPHSSSFPLTTAPLQTLHMDVWGPARVPGQGGERYFLLVVDDYTRYTTVFPLQSKAEVRSVLIRWIRAVRRHLSARF
ncbi:unnamed protein product, partial [Closterium sp. NIES-54]